ncbi:MAG: NosD domain-containing protein, partial [Candidatus Aenigmatarchaeota archaeon]
MQKKFLIYLTISLIQATRAEGGILRISKNFNSIRKILVEIGVVILYFYMLLPVANSATPISSCTDINSPGEYYLERSLISTTAYCISIWANNVILDCRGYKIDGFGAPKVYGKNYGIYVTRNNIQTTNITIKNCVVTNWVNGIYLSKSSGNTITGSTISSNSNGIYLYESSGNTITGSTISSNSNGIFHHAGSLSNLVYYNRIEKNEVGIQIGPYAGRDWLIYNNLFNNSANVYVSQQNNWNTIQQSGTRIYSQGREIGGNYWTNYTNNGYSDICNDANCDGFCDQPFILNDLNIDYLPLSNKYDADPPTYYNPSYSTPYAGYPVNFSILLKDNCAGLFHYEFWFDNCTGNLIKVAEEDYWWGYVPQKWVNLTLEINSTVGCMIRWCLKFVDKNGNLYDNCGWPFYFYTRLPPFYSEADLISPPPQFEIIQGRTFLVNASVTCKGYRAQCLNVSATVRYNRTTSLPNFPINETEGAKPLHVVKTKVWPYNYTCISNCMKNPYEDELDDDSDFLLEVYEYNGQRGIAEFKYYGISPNS